MTQNIAQAMFVWATGHLVSHHAVHALRCTEHPMGLQLDTTTTQEGYCSTGIGQSTLPTQKSTVHQGRGDRITRTYVCIACEKLCEKLAKACETQTVISYMSMCEERFL